MCSVCQFLLRLRRIQTCTPGAPQDRVIVYTWGMHILWKMDGCLGLYS